MSNQYLSFDVTKQSTPQQLITGRQGDSQLKFVSVLLWDGDKNIPYDLTGKQIAFEALKPDGTHIVDYVGVTILDAPHGLFRYSFNEQVFAVAGKIQQAFFKITHTDKDDQVIADSTLEINIHILENRVEFGIDSTNYLSEYDDLIAQVKQKFDDYAENVQDNIKYVAQAHADIEALIKQISDNDIVTSSTFNEYATAVGRFTGHDSLEDDFSNGITEAGGEIPDYMANGINSLAHEVSDNTFNIGFITDNHLQLTSYAPHSLKHYSYIAALSRKTKLNAIIANGDNINGYYEKHQKIIETRQATSTLFERSDRETDVFFVFGNHDSGIGQRGNNTPDTVITENEIKKMYRTNKLLYGEVRNGDSLYGYKDYKNDKIRVIWLNSFDLPWTLNSNGTYKYNFVAQSGYGNEQLNWLANKALIFPDDGWEVMIFTHAPLPDVFGNISTAVSTDGKVVQQFNSDVLIAIINAFQNSVKGAFNDEDRTLPVNLSYDFSNQKNKTVIGLFSGHIHSDGNKVAYGINCIETAASLCLNEDTNRIVNTLSEDCWDVISIDKQKRLITMHRFGYGTSREISY